MISIPKNAPKNKCRPETTEFSAEYARDLADAEMRRQRAIARTAASRHPAVSRQSRGLEPVGPILARIFAEAASRHIGPPQAPGDEAELVQADQGGAK